jgi:hypothetical protein
MNIVFQSDVTQLTEESVIRLVSHSAVTYLDASSDHGRFLSAGGYIRRVHCPQADAVKGA